MKKILASLPFRLVLALGVGIILGIASNENIIHVVLSIRHITSQIIFFCVPLIILGSVAPSIIRLGKNASRFLAVSILVVYFFLLGAASFGLLVGYTIIPSLSIADSSEARRVLPTMLFELNFPPIMAVMSALILAILIGLATVWTKSETFSKLLEEFQHMVSSIVMKIVIPILPVFIMGTFAVMAYDGRLTGQLPVFIHVIGVLVAAQTMWLILLYSVAGIYSKRNPLEVIKHYAPVYLTAIGTMSSSVTMPVALDAAKKSKVLNREIVDFGIPFFTHFHMAGAAINAVFLSLAVSQVLYGALPSIEVMIMFIVLQSIFTMAGPGVPAGVLMASIGLISAVLGFNEAAIGLMIVLWSIQDSFGTACNITGDGALLMIFSRYTEKRVQTE